MTEPAITEAELMEGYGVEMPGTGLVPARPSAPTVTPPVGAGELVARLATIRDAMDRAMTPNVDYGVIPGTDKPTLLKPGAEKLSALFQLDVQLENEKLWDPPHLTVISHATVYHAPSGSRLGYGEGICSTREKKYAFRNASRACPECGKPAIIKGKAEYGGGWVCFKKKDGCGAKFSDSDERLTGQEVGQIDNPDLADTWNTVVKMAEKRARVDAVLAVTGASAIFTQDAEDLASGDGPPQAPAAAPSRPFGPEYDKKLLGAVVAAACVKLAGDRDRGITLFKVIRDDCGGYFPTAAALAVVHCADTTNLVPDVEPPEL